MKPHAVDCLELDSEAREARLDERSWRLSPAAAHVLSLADGERTLETIVSSGPHDEAEVWDALDALADAGLLRERLAPPAGGANRHVVRVISRRESFARAAAAVAAVGVGLRIGTASAQEADDRADDEHGEDLEGLKRVERQARQHAEEAAKRVQACQRNAEQRKKRGEAAPNCNDETQRLEAARRREKHAKGQVRAQESRRKQQSRRREANTKRVQERRKKR